MQCWLAELPALHADVLVVAEPCGMLVRLPGEKALNRGTQWNLRELMDQFWGFTEDHIEAIKRVDRHIRKEYRPPPQNLVGRTQRLH